MGSQGRCVTCRQPGFPFQQSGSHNLHQLELPITGPTKSSPRYSIFIPDHGECWLRWMELGSTKTSIKTDSPHNYSRGGNPKDISTAKITQVWFPPFWYHMWCIIASKLSSCSLLFWMLWHFYNFREKICFLKNCRDRRHPCVCGSSRQPRRATSLGPERPWRFELPIKSVWVNKLDD